MIDVLEQMLVTLVGLYPPGHFGGREPKDYINGVIANLFTWHRAHLEPNGGGTGGTIIGTIVGGYVMDDLEQMVLKLVFSLAEHLDDFDFSRWQREWDSAYEPQATGAEASSVTVCKSELGETVQPENYTKRILGRWLGPRKYISFFADGGWGIQRNEDAPIEIHGRRWRIEVETLFLTFQGDTDLVTSKGIITSFTTKQFITEADGHKRTYVWTP